MSSSIFLLHWLWQASLAQASPIPLLFLIIPFLVVLYRSVCSDTKTNFPPSPRKLPVIGNLHQLGRLPHRSLHSLARKHGPIMLLHFGQKPVLVVSSPATAKEVMKTQDHIFADRPPLKAARVLLYDGKDVAFAPYGEYWRQAKKLSVLHLLSLKKVELYRLIREQEVALMVDKISSSCSNRRGSMIIDMSELLNSLTKDIISRALLGESTRKKSWGQSIMALIEESSKLLGEFNFDDFFPGLLARAMSTLTGVDARLHKVFKETDRILDGILDELEKNSSRVEYDQDGGAVSFADVLLTIKKDRFSPFQLDREKIKSLLKDMFGAGTESTFVSMDWIMAELIRNPAAMKKLKTELRDIANGGLLIKEEDLAKLKYLKAVVKESFRLHPPGPNLVPRQSMATTTIQGLYVPANSMVLVNVWSIGRDPEIWESPEKFMPERFIGNDVDFYGHDYQLTPFGAGRRVCPGINFAVPIIELTVANVVHQFDFSLPDGMRGEELDMTEAPGLVCRRRANLGVIATPSFGSNNQYLRDEE